MPKKRHQSGQRKSNIALTETKKQAPAPLSQLRRKLRQSSPRET